VIIPVSVEDAYGYIKGDIKLRDLYHKTETFIFDRFPGDEIRKYPLSDLLKIDYEPAADSDLSDLICSDEASAMRGIMRSSPEINLEILRKTT
jgi:hypothetical protein